MLIYNLQLKTKLQFCIKIYCFLSEHIIIIIDTKVMDFDEEMERVSSTESEKSEKDVNPRDTEFIIQVFNDKKIMFSYTLKAGRILPYTRMMKGETFVVHDVCLL